MAVDLTYLIELAQKLPQQQKLKLIAALSNDMASQAHLEQASDEFWRPKSLEQIVREQQVQPVVSIAELSSDVWQEDENVEDFLEFMRQQRQEALVQENP